MNAFKPFDVFSLNMLMFHGGAKTMVKAVLSLEGGTFSSLVLETTASTLEIVGTLPSGMNYDEPTKTISGTPDGSQYGFQKYDILLDGSQTITGGLTVILAENQAQITSKIAGTEPAITVVPSDLNSITTTNINLLHDGAGGWVFLFPYMTSYRNDNQIIIYDDIGTLIENKAFREGEAINLMRSITANNTYTLLGANEGIIHKYDHVTETLDYAFTLPHIGGSYFYLTIATNGNVVCARTGVDDKVHVMEFDDTTYTVTDYTFDTSTDLNEANAASDTTHVYFSTAGANGEFATYSKLKLTPFTETKLSAVPGGGNPVTQSEYGTWICIIGDTHAALADGYYYVYNGGLVYAGTSFNDLNIQTKPWVNQEDIPLNYYGSVQTGRPLDTNNDDLIPLPETTTGYFWIDPLADGTWSRISILNIATYNIAFNNITKVADKVLSTTRDYVGYSIFDVVTQTNEEVRFATNGVSTTVFVEIGGYLYICGYPSGTLHRYDPTQAWQLGDPDLNPDETPTITNPEFIGYTRGDGIDGGTGGGQHAITALFGDHDGNLWVGGDWRRDGAGMGITKVFTITDDSMLGFRPDAFKDLTPTDGCLTTNYAVFVGYDLLTDAVTLTMIKLSDNTITYATIDAQYTAGGRVRFVKDDTVLIATALTDGTLCFVGVNVATGATLYTNNLTGVTTTLSKTLDGYNRLSEESFLQLSDTNHYVKIGDHLNLVDKYTGKLIANKTILFGTNVTENQGKLYSVDATQTKSVSDYLIPTVLQDRIVEIPPGATLTTVTRIEVITIVPVGTATIDGVTNIFADTGNVVQTTLGDTFRLEFRVDVADTPPDLSTVYILAEIVNSATGQSIEVTQCVFVTVDATGASVPLDSTSKNLFECTGNGVTLKGTLWFDLLTTEAADFDITITMGYEVA